MINAEFHDRATAERWLKLERQGVRVSVYHDDVTEVDTWCRENCQGDYARSHDKVLIDDDVYQRSIDIADGLIPNPRKANDSNWLEAMITDALARDLQREIDREILDTLGVTTPSMWFWFENHNDAMLFKLTWGGE